MLSIAEMCLAYGDKLTYAGVTSVLGSADFATNAKLVAALLAADMPTALTATEEALAAGKGVGVLLKDILELLNEVAIAKMCKNAEKLLALPKEFFAEVRRIADGADGRAILRATEIFTKTENELRYASSPRISLETAILRAAMPQTDLDADALLLRVSALEKRLAQAASGAPAGIPATAAPAPQPAPAKEPETRKPARAEDELPPLPEPPPEDDVPPWEEVRREAAPAAAVKPLRVRTEEPDAAPFAPAAPLSGAPAASSVPDDSPEAVFGLFLRRLRKLPKSGVAYALCRDLAPSKEGGTLVLTTDVRTVADTLNGERHRSVMQEVFAELGVSQFEVRYVSAGHAEEKDGVQKLKEDFAGYPIEVK